MESDDILAVLSGLRGAEGRFDQVVDKNTGKCGIIDYAHTPDALKTYWKPSKRLKILKAKLSQ